MCYSILASVTDYDCWHPEHASVSVEMVIENLQKNVDSARAVLKKVVTRTPAERRCACASALKNAVVTAPDRISERARRELGIFINKHHTN